MKGNSLAWFGNGLSQRQIEMKGTTEVYLDQPAVPVENPLEKPRIQHSTNGVNGTPGDVNGTAVSVTANVSSLAQC